MEHEARSIRELEIPKELATANAVKQIMIDQEGLEGDDLFAGVNTAILRTVMDLESRIYFLEQRLGG